MKNAVEAQETSMHNLLYVGNVRIISGTKEEDEPKDDLIKY